MMDWDTIVEAGQVEILRAQVKSGKVCPVCQGWHWIPYDYPGDEMERQPPEHGDVECPLCGPIGKNWDD